MYLLTKIGAQARAIAVVGSAIIAVTGSATAQGYDWEGFYAGATLGGAIYGVETSDLTDNITNDAPGVQTLVPSYGISGHYNWVPFGDNLVVGVELDATFGLLNEEFVSFNTDGDNGFEFINSWDSVISLRGRAGMTSGKLHSFVAGGPAFATAVYEVRNVLPLAPGDDPGCGTWTCATVDETLTGISIGAGMEYAFRDDWIAKFEIMHYAMPTVTAPLLDGGDPACGDAEDEECTVSFNSSSSLFRIGVSYKF